MEENGLENIKVGDKVAHYPSGWGQTSVATVESSTRTLIRVNGYAFNRKNGFRRGGGQYDSAKIGPVTSELEAEWEKKVLARKLSKVDYEELSMETLQEIKKVILKETK